MSAKALSGHRLLRRTCPLASQSGHSPVPQNRKPRRSEVSGSIANIWDLYAKSSRQIDLMILLLHQDFANLFGHRKLSKPLTLPDASAIIANGFVFIF